MPAGRQPGSSSKEVEVDAKALYFSPHRVLDYRIMELNLNPLFEQPMETPSRYEHYLRIKKEKKNMAGTIIMQLGDFEPVQFHFRGYPLATPSAGVVCLLPKKEDRMMNQQLQQQEEQEVADKRSDEKERDEKTKVEEEDASCLKGPLSVAIMTPLQLTGYQCVARGSVEELPSMTHGQLWELNKGFDRPSISLRYAKVVEQSLVDIDLVHGAGVTSRAGNMQLLVRIVQIKAPPVEPQIAFEFVPHPQSLSRALTKTSPTQTFEALGQYELMEGLHRSQGAEEQVRASLRSLRGKVTRMSSDMKLPSYIETDPHTGLEREKHLRSSLRSSVNTSLGVSLDIHGGIRWRNPNDIEWKPPIPDSVLYRTYDNSKDEHNFKPFANRQTMEYKEDNVKVPSSSSRKRPTLIERHNHAVRSTIGTQQNDQQLHGRKAIDHTFVMAMQDAKIACTPNVDLLLPSKEAEELGIEFTPHGGEEAVHVLDTSFDSVMDIHNDQLHEYVPVKGDWNHIAKYKDKQMRRKGSSSSNIGSDGRKSGTGGVGVGRSGTEATGKKSTSSTSASTGTTQKHKYRGDSEILLQNLAPPPPPLLLFSKPVDERRKK